LSQWCPRCSPRGVLLVETSVQARWRARRRRPPPLESRPKRMKRPIADNPAPGYGTLRDSSDCSPDEPERGGCEQRDACLLGGASVSSLPQSACAQDALREPVGLPAHSSFRGGSERDGTRLAQRMVTRRSVRTARVTVS
jgi:hypothetical protein